MNSTIKRVLAPIASLKLTVCLLAAAMVLVLAGTCAQIDADIWTVQHRYFHSWLAYVPFQLFLPRPRPGAASFPGGFPFVGGYTLIVLLLANLLAAHTVRFKFTWKRSGILLIHFGLILLLVGEIVTSRFAREGQMQIDEGASLNYTEDTHFTELSVVDRTPADHDNVVVIPSAALKRGAEVRDAKLPFAVRVDDYYANSQILGPAQAGKRADPRATAGAGQKLTVLSMPLFSGAGDDAEKGNVPSAYVTLAAPDGKPLGTYLVSYFLGGPQEVKVGDKSYWIQLRPKRYYKPYTVELLKFTHDRYVGTDTPKNFASLIRLTDPSHNVDREVKIWMNHPLRYGGDTFYQQSFLNNDKTTVLQIVHNPGWTMPYFACAIGALGLLIHFGMHLVGFLRRVRRENAAAAAAAQVAPSRRKGSTYSLAPRRPAGALSALVAVVVVAVCGIYLLGSAWQRPSSGEYNYDALARVPVVYEGRTLPLDSLARNCLRILSNVDTVRTADGKSVPAIQWLVEVMSDTEASRAYPVFRIDHPDIKSLLGLDASASRFAFKDVVTNGEKLSEQVRLAANVPEKERDLYQQKITQLWGHLMLYSKLRFWDGKAEMGWDGIFAVPPLEPGEEWQNYTQVKQRFERTQQIAPAARALADVFDAYRDHKPAEFNAALADYNSLLQQKIPAVMDKAGFEVFFNHAGPFVKCMALYVLVFVLTAVAWLAWPPLSRAALWLLVMTLAVHTGGLACRIYLSGRPPVTNLYSSAIFIGWGAVLLAAGLEALFRNGIGAAVAALVGFVTLFIAHHLALSPQLSPNGDTMEMMRAVLDTNFWLATHVVCITLGYATTFLTGALALTYVAAGVFTNALDADRRKSLARMVYGTICFAMFFSFVGTILGGIWADQSWGRFWGWDPKENGAVLIVLWNALILHARWGGIARERGVMCLAIFGNVVTSWSWFGTNMLGVGLHSYGFMESACFWLVAFVLSQLAMIALGNLPTNLWRSFAPRDNAPSEESKGAAAVLTPA